MSDDDKAKRVERVRNISVFVYKKLLGEDDTRRMLAKDNDGGKKLRNRAGCYDHVVAATLEAIGMQDEA